MEWLAQQTDTGLVPADQFPRGALVLGLSGTERTRLRWGTALWAVGIFAAGWWLGRIR
jgi:hypothetical protein